VIYEPQDLVHILEDSLSSLPVNSFPVRLRSSREFSDGIPKILGDYLQLKQAVSNVIKNACESMGERESCPSVLYPFLQNGSSMEAGGERYGERD